MQFEQAGLSPGPDSTAGQAAQRFSEQAWGSKTETQPRDLSVPGNMPQIHNESDPANQLNPTSDSNGRIKNNAPAGDPSDLQITPLPQLQPAKPGSHPDESLIHKK